jgi:hypothetical protein
MYLGLLGHQYNTQANRRSLHRFDVQGRKKPALQAQKTILQWCTCVGICYAHRNIKG